jgi:hypothetical protein
VTFPGHVERSNASTKFFKRRLVLAIIMVLAAGLAFGLWFFFIYDSHDAVEKSENYLPPNCYSINAKQICPKP